jgi:hypothetical protein
MIQIGVIKLVQVQRSSLKLGQKPDRRYDPAGLLTVDSLELSADGVIGLTADGGRIVDIHNARHPDNKNRGDNGVSIGFTSHYRDMRLKFGDHLTDGIAGENIIIEAERGFQLADLGERLVIVNPATGQQFTLQTLGVADPCEPFSRFAAGRDLDAPEMKATLQFLGAGKRGFLVTPADGSAQLVVQAGDVVYRAD